jgi:hypothetical protein
VAAIRTVTTATRMPPVTDPSSDNGNPQKISIALGAPVTIGKESISAMSTDTNMILNLFRKIIKFNKIHGYSKTRPRR